MTTQKGRNGAKTRIISTKESSPYFLRLSASFQKTIAISLKSIFPDQSDFKCILSLIIITLEGTRKTPVGDPFAKAHVPKGGFSGHRQVWFDWKIRKASRRSPTFCDHIHPLGWCHSKLLGAGEFSNHSLSGRNASFHEIQTTLQ